MKLLLLSVVVSALGLSACTQEEVNASSGFAGDVMVEPGAEKELCFSAKKDSEVVFRFESNQALSFNFHYHLNNKTYFPIPEHTTMAEKGQYIVAKDETYCLNWINVADTSATLSTQIEGGSQFGWSD